MNRKLNRKWTRFIQSALTALTFSLLAACSNMTPAPGDTAELRPAATTFVVENLGSGLGEGRYNAYLISSNGKVIVGNYDNSTGYRRIFRWEDGVMQDLGTPSGSDSVAQYINIDGSIIVGRNLRSDGNAYFRWTDGVVEEIIGLDGSSDQITAMSADGTTLVGYFSVAPGQSHAFRLKNGVFQDLGTFGGDFSAAAAVSADGSVVIGNSQTATGEYHPFRWTDSGMGALETLGGSQYSARWVSADGSVVVGEFYDNQQRAFLWKNGVMRDLGLEFEGSDYFSTMFVSADGSVVIARALYNVDRGVRHERTFRWENGVVENIGTLEGATPNTTIDPSAISADGSVIVGTQNDNEGNSKAFRWENGVMEELGTLPDASSPQSGASGVSADGSVVVGVSSSASGNRPVRWTAQTTPPPNDNDGIETAIDGRYENGAFIDESAQVSSNFTDQHLGGTSFGLITDRSDVAVSVTDSPNAGEGVVLSGQGGTGTARVKPCGVAFTLSLTDGDSVVATCGSLLTQTVSGSVDITLSNSAVVSVPQGATAFTDEQADGNFTVENRSSGRDLTITFEGQTRTVTPGQSADAEPKIDIYTISFDGVPTGRVISSVRLNGGVISSTGTSSDRVYLYALRQDKSGNTAMVTGNKRELTISKDGRSQTSYAKGGNIVFAFGEFGSGRVAVKELTVAGTTSTGGFVEVYRGSTRLERVSLPKTGASGSRTLTLTAENSNGVRVFLNGIGRIDNLSFEAPVE